MTPQELAAALTDYSNTIRPLVLERMGEDWLIRLARLSDAASVIYDTLHLVQPAQEGLAMYGLMEE